MLLVAGLLCYFPALVISMVILLGWVIPPKYVRKNETVLSLFRR